MRNNLIIKERRENPSITLKAIGEKFELSRERIRQILLEAEEPTASLGHSTPTLPLWAGQTLIEKPCSYCGKLQKYRKTNLEWQIAHNRHSPNRFFCSKVCQGKWLGNNHGFAAHPENAAPQHFGGHHTEATKAKMSQIQKNNWQDKEVQAKHSRSMVNRWQDPEYRAIQGGLILAIQAIKGKLKGCWRYEE